jgi:hypothetical protein
MKVRNAALCLVVTFAVGIAGAHAQGPPAGGPGANASLAARIDALEARAAESEARLAALETIDESDVIGRYQLAYLGIQLNRGDSTPTTENPGGQPARVGTSEGNAVVTLNADHTVQFSDGASLSCKLPVLTFGVASCDVPEEEEGEPPTWSIDNGLLRIGADPNDSLVFRLAASGVFVAADSSEFEPGHGWAVVLIMTKLAN